MKNTRNYLAKSDKNGRFTLFDHTIAVVNFIVFVLERVVNRKLLENSDVKYDDVKKNAVISGLFHDIGKCFCKVQKKLNNVKNIMTDDGLESVKPNPNKKDKEQITHNLFSWAYLMQHVFVDDSVLASVLNHHVVYDHLLDYTATELNGIIEEEDGDVFCEFVDEMSKYAKDKFGVCIDKVERDNDRRVGETSIFYNMSKKDTKSFEKNSMFFIVRTILIYADRIVSGHQDDMRKFVDNDKEFMNGVFESSVNVNGMPEDIVNEVKDENGNFVYDKERLKSQNDLLDKINKSNNCIIKASPGYGKTLVALRWIMGTKKRTLWVTPRNVIARNTYVSIKEELKKMGYEDKISVGLILGDEDYKEEFENADIIVTNIDNFLSPMVKNNEAHTLINIMNSNVVFDEYHEFITEGAMFAGFLSVVFTRVRFTNSKTLLMSATESRFDERYWNEPDHKFVDFIESEDIFNGGMIVNISYKEYGNVKELNNLEDDSFAICETVNQAQDCYSSVINDNKALIHSHYTKNDRNEIESRMYELHGKYGDVVNRNVVVGTSIMGTGLDMSAKNIYDFVVSPEDTIQRCCGRGGRFGEEEYENEINYHVCALINNRAFNNQIPKRYNLSLHDKWMNILKEYDGKSLTKKELYDLYSKFYEDNKKKAYEYWDERFVESCLNLIKLRPYPCRKRSNKKGKLKLSNKLGFRGVNDSIFVIAECDDGTLSEPITLSKSCIPRNELTAFATKDVKQKRYKYLRDRVEDFKRVCPGWHNLSDEIAMRYALDEETPFLLYYARYNKEYGLILGANSPSKAQDDYDLD